MKNFGILFLVVLLFWCEACNLEESPKAQLSKSDVFGSEEGLENYTNSFYNAFPSTTSLFNSLSYYIAMPSVTRYLQKDAYTPDDQGGWSWTQLRNINFFITNNEGEELSEDIRNNYTGIARFFRAYFYFDKVKEFGDVPWIDRPLDVDDSLLTATRDDRTFIMEKIRADLEFARDNITNVKDESSSTITSTVAAAFLSRVCLWEGTFRKYHTEEDLGSSAEEWLEEAAEAAQFVMDKGGYSIYKGSGPELAYRDLFTSRVPISDEVLYAVTFDQGAGVVHDGNHRWISSTWAGTPALIHTVVNTYLNLDGSRFTDQSDFDKKSFLEEVQNRDYRLQQTIKTPGYTRLDGNEEVFEMPDFNVGYTGYDPIKFTLKSTESDNSDVSDNNIIVFRYAEVLLNYAEAKAELGTLTDGDWRKTVGELRERAGITGGLDAKPTVPDPYLQEEFFPNVTDPSILEIRRERAIELSLEGFGFADLQRWKVGELLAKPLSGIYINDFETPFDFDGDGSPDIVFTTDLNYEPSGGLTKIYLGETLENGASNNYQLDEDGHRLIYLKNEPRTWEDKLYFHPVPHSALVRNPDLGQNPGWE